MKRSEILEVLGEFLYEVGDEEKMPFGLDYEAERLLGWLEKRGMQPPTIKATFPLTKSDGTVQKSYTMVARWEPENEA